MNIVAIEGSRLADIKLVNKPAGGLGRREHVMASLRRMLALTFVITSTRWRWSKYYNMCWQAMEIDKEANRNE